MGNCFGLLWSSPKLTAAYTSLVMYPMSAIGPKRTSLVAPHMSAFGGKADMTFCGANVCFRLKADIPQIRNIMLRSCALGIPVRKRSEP
jgi:hypothetical protein